MAYKRVYYQQHKEEIAKKKKANYKYAPTFEDNKIKARWIFIKRREKKYGHPPTEEELVLWEKKYDKKIETKKEYSYNLGRQDVINELMHKCIEWNRVSHKRIPYVAILDIIEQLGEG